MAINSGYISSRLEAIDEELKALKSRTREELDQLDAERQQLEQRHQEVVARMNATRAEAILEEKRLQGAKSELQALFEEI